MGVQYKGIVLEYEWLSLAGLSRRIFLRRFYLMFQWVEDEVGGGIS